MGEALLVAPVLGPGVTRRTVRLPRGSWYPHGDDVPVSGGDSVDVEAPLGTVRTFVRAGAVVPVEDTTGRVHLHAFVPPEGQAGRGWLYLDAGDGAGPWRYEHYTLRRTGSRLRISAHVEGTTDLPGPEALRIVGATVRSARVDGRVVPVADGTLLLGRWSVLDIDLQ